MFFLFHQFERKFERADREQKKKRELKNLVADQRLRTEFRQRYMYMRAVRSSTTLWWRLLLLLFMSLYDGWYRGI